jgi:hypothetical protein
MEKYGENKSNLVWVKKKTVAQYFVQNIIYHGEITFSHCLELNFQ